MTEQRLTEEFKLKRRELVLLAFILVAGLGVRLYYFGGTYGSDDLRHAYHSYFLFQPEAREAAELWCSKAVCYFRMGVNLPLSAVIRLFGPHEWAMALVPLTASLASIGIVFALLRRLSGPVVGLLGAATYAFLPTDIYVATVWLQDDVFVCFFALALFCLVRAHESARRGRIWALAAGLALGYMQICKESAFLLLGVIALWSLNETRKARQLHFVGLYALIGFLVSQVLVGLLFYSLEDDFYYYPARVYNTIRDVRAACPASFTYREIFEILGSYAFEQWYLGFAAAALPLTALLTFLNRNIKYRLLIGLIFLAQLVIVCQPMRWTPFQSRYMLQLTLPFVLVTALGVGTGLQRLPGAWRRCVTVLAFALLVASGVSALDADRQQYSRTRAEGLRRAYAYLDDSAEADDPIYMDDRGWGRAERILYQFNGFQRFKGGFRSINAAYAATSGWVVLSCFDRHVDIGERWLEVYRCDDPRYWARVYRILPRRPDWDMTILQPSDTSPLYLPQPYVAEELFTPIALDEPAEAYRSYWGADPETVALTRADGGIRVDVVADETANHGGMRFYTPGLRALRFSVSLRNAKGIRALFVDGCDARGHRLTRWEWRLRGGRIPTGEPEPIVLVPGRASGYFRAAGEADPDAIDEVHVFINAAPDSEAGFLLRDVSVVPTPIVQPDLGAYALRPLEFSSDVGDHESHWSSGARRANLRRVGRGIACALETDPGAPSTGLYGGVRIPVAGVRALRMTADFDQIENIDAIYVDGYDTRRKRVLRWCWRCSPARRPGPGPVEFALVPGQRSGAFVPSGGTDGDAVEELHVFVQGRPGSTCGFTLEDVAVAETPLHRPDLSEFDLRSLPLDAPLDTYWSRWSAKTRNVVLGHDGSKGLRCTVEPDADAVSNARYGGIKWMVAGVGALRLRATFEQPENIETIYIDGYARDRRRVFRWQWSLTPTRRPKAELAEYDFIPGETSAYFKPVGDAAGEEATELHVFLRAKPGTTCGFVVHDLLVAAPPLPEPDVSAYTFAAIDLVDPVEQWLSPKWCTAREVSVASTSAGLRCEVTAGRAQAQYGGIRVSGEDIGALRLTVTLLHTEYIEVVYADGYNPDGDRVARWSWRPSRTDVTESASEVWTFVPGEPTGRFRWTEGEAAGPISAVDVFVRVAAEASAGLLIQSVEVAATGGE